MVKIMAMIKCPECGKEMSDRASLCPNCGCPIEDIRSAISEIEFKHEQAAKVKEEEKKAKEVAAEIKRKQKEEAKKAITPAMKRKRIIMALILAVFAVGAGICGWYYGIKIPREQAYQAYILEVEECIDAIGNCNEAIKAYNEVAKEVIALNNEFETVIQSAQELVDCGDTPFEGEKITMLSNSIKDARNNKIKTPELIELVAEPQPVDPEMINASRAVLEEQTIYLSGEKNTYLEKETNIKAQKEKLVIPDYSDYISVLNGQSKELEDSYIIQKQITAPAESWVMTRLGRVSDVANMAPVTEENDPNGILNKAGGYTSTVYFGTPLLGTENLTGDAIIEAGTDVGGAVETYRTVEEAEARNSYLAAFDGSGILSPGSHEVFGTMVIRTSDDLKASQQETVTNAIEAAMIELD